MSPVSPHPPKKIVIVGSSGRLGGLLIKSFGGNHSVTGLSRAQLDLGCSESIVAALEPLDYDLLIIAGALTGVDYCETNEAEAFAINATGPGKIAEISAGKNAHVTYFSTDMVYDGSKPEPYSEADAPNPISVYGASKLNGEDLVLQASPGNLVLRVSWLYGPGRPAFPEWIINKACAEAHVTLPGNKIGCSTSTVDLLGLLPPLLFGPDVASGVFNLCNSGPCTWRDWGQFCIDTARAAGLPVLADHIEGVPVDSVPAFVAKRPVNSAMSTGKYTAFTGVTPRNWQEANREFLQQSELFKKHTVSPSAV
ncbi:MAG: NAD(P)-dependent oxidoreductase [Luteolibacter sp.]|uniref:SDR family oxidoreductase n=1 Tax=Luteolibacter sp. TaxID=1962973 RepID=UPI0032655B81